MQRTFPFHDLYSPHTICYKNIGTSMVYTYPYIFDKHVINPIKDSVHNKFRNKSATYHTATKTES